MSNNDEFSTLVQNARTGDESAFSEIFRRCYDRLRVFAWRIIFDSQAAEDIAQETLIRAARGLRGLRDDKAFEGWIFRIAANLARDHLRAIASHERKVEAAAVDASNHEDCSKDVGPVQRALMSLPANQREAVALVYYEGCTHAEAAHRSGCAEATISWRVMLAKRALKKLLRP